MEDLLKSMDILLQDLTPTQIEGLRRVAPKLNNLSAQQAMSIIKELDLDIEKLQKNARKVRAELYQKNKKPKVCSNEKCPCGSDKKYKKCCIWKTD